MISEPHKMPWLYFMYEACLGSLIPSSQSVRLGKKCLTTFAKLTNGLLFLIFSATLTFFIKPPQPGAGQPAGAALAPTPCFIESLFLATVYRMCGFL